MNQPNGRRARVSVVSLAQRHPLRRPITPTWLVCLNLRNRFVTAGHPLFVPDAGEVTVQISRALAFARKNDWRIVHVVARGPTREREGSSLNGSVAGLEPKVDEPVYEKTGPSVFSARDILDHAKHVGPAEIVVVGLAPALDWIATALDARRFGWPIRLVTDAMGMPALASRSPEDARSTLSVLLAPIADLAPLDQAFAQGHCHGV